MTDDADRWQQLPADGKMEDLTGMVVPPVMRPAERIGIIGLGKVGLALALVMRHYGQHSVVGWDIDPAAVGRFQTQLDLHPEDEMRQLLATGQIPLAPGLDALVRDSDTIFIVVPTPHPKGYEGTTPMANKIPIDFDYGPLGKATSQLGQAMTRLGVRRTVVLVSTVTPGVARQHLTPLHCDWAYSPVFISLGTVVRDLLSPDFILVGSDLPEVASRVERLWCSIVNTAPVIRTQVETAELAKLSLNVAVTQRIDLMNQLAMLADSVGADIDGVAGVLNHSSKLRWLPRAGLGDGGACRPRDTVVLDRKFLNVGHLANVANGLIASRERHSAWLAYKIAQLADETKLPVVLVGGAYKPGVPYADGSPSWLLLNDLVRLGVGVDLVDRFDLAEQVRSIWVPCHPHMIPIPDLPHGSIVVDPWGTMARSDNYQLIRPGRLD